MSRFVELNHVLEPGMPAYPGLPEPRFGAVVDHEGSRGRYHGKAEFYIGTVNIVGNTGTYLDSPFHRYPDAPDLSEIPLNRVAGLDGIVLDGMMGAAREVDVDAPAAEIRGRAVLVRTGWDQRWGSERYWELGPYLSSQSVERLVDAGAALVGVDFWNIDDTQDPARPVHTRLLGVGTPIVEHLCNLGSLPRTGFRFTAVPLRIARGASFPVRAYAELAG